MGKMYKSNPEYFYGWEVPEPTMEEHGEYKWLGETIQYCKCLDPLIKELSTQFGQPSQEGSFHGWYPEGDHIVFYAGGTVSIANPGDTILVPSGVQYQVHPIIATSEQVSENYKIVGSV